MSKSIRSSYLVPLLTLLLILTSCNRLFVNPDALHLQAAEEFSRKKEYDKAIEEYRAHIRYRLAIKERPEWENPYFYLVLIGDLQLIESKADAALSTYLEAEQQGVDPNLISDRYRSLASWYEDRGSLEKAVSLLKSRRNKDPILIDAMLDRLSKSIVAREQSAEPSRKQKGSPGPY